MILDKDRITYNEYIETKEVNKRCELINGEIFMHPSPKWEHQSISMELGTQINNKLRSDCRVFASPFDLCLLDYDIREETENIFQPDLLIVCDRNRLNGTGYFGVPSFIVEILSKSTIKHDRIFKYNMYQRYKVPEYWIVDPLEKSVEVHVLKNEFGGVYVKQGYSVEDKEIRLNMFDITIDLEKMFKGI